jgi:hypothetical protein
MAPSKAVYISVTGAAPSLYASIRAAPVAFPIDNIVTL